MRNAGARPWALLDDATLRRHDLVRMRVDNAPLVQRFEERGGRPFLVNLTFLSSRPELAKVLANSFWEIYQLGPRSATANRTAQALKLFDQFLKYRSKSQTDLRVAKDLTADQLKEFAVWLVAERHLKRKNAANNFTTACCFLRKAQRLYPKEFDPLFSTPKNLFAGADNDRAQLKTLSTTDFQKILAAAESDVRRIRETYKPGDVPTSAQDIVPFMVIIAARTGINPQALYALDRDCLRRRPLLLYLEQAASGPTTKAVASCRPTETNGRAGTDSLPASIYGAAGIWDGSPGMHQALPLP
jgi:hypothetical protein